MSSVVLSSMEWIYRVLITLILAVVCVAIVGLAVRTEVNTIDIQRELLFNRILYDPQGFLYTDPETGVTETTVFDFALVEQAHTDSVFVYERLYGGARVTVTDGATTKEVTINPETYELLRVPIEAGVTNSGTMTTRSYPVVIHDNGDRRNGWVTITVVVPART